MHPVLFHVGATPVPSYAVMVGLGFLAAWLIRRAEVRRLGHARQPGYLWVGVGCLLGAMLGSKLGMLLFEPPEDFARLLAQMTSWDFSGKTVVGGLAGGYVGVEVAKKLVGITTSTGDAFAVAVPAGQALGRVGCLLEGCCYGTTWNGPWAIHLHGALRHPVQAYEAVMDLALAAMLFTIRRQTRPAGHLFKVYLVGYGMTRFLLEWLRGDPALTWAGLTLVQWVCLAAVIGFGRRVWGRKLVGA
ncbi:MAG: prolipoprotein diacylglyceryl transferase [Myxococcota bacterium]